MIQRIQSIYLLIAAIIPIILLFIPIGTLINEIGFYTYTPFSVKVINTDDVILTSVYNALLLILSTLVSLTTIFFYKKRKLQVRMININMIIILGALFSMFYIYPKMVFSKYQILADSVLDFNTVILITLFTAVGLYLAKRAILKDEALVKSTERLR
jgi:cation transport ATPase